MLLESVSRGFWRRAPAALTRPLVLVAVFLAWVPFRAADFGSVLACYRALGHGGWAPPSLGLPVRGRGPGPGRPASASRSRRPRRRRRPAGAAGRGSGAGALWPAAGVAVALLTHLFWGAAEKAFIYFRF